MHMIPFYVFYAPFLAVLAVGVAMYVWGLNIAEGKEIAKAFGKIIALLAILLIIYNTYLGIKMRELGCCKGQCMTKMNDQNKDANQTPAQ